MPLLTVKEAQGMLPALNNKLGGKIANWLLDIGKINQLGDLVDSLSQYKGAEFAGKMLERLPATYEVYGADNLDKLPDGPFITISNHPYGGLDGLMLIEIISQYRDNYRVMVNKLLDRFPQLHDNFITVTPVGEARTAATVDSIAGTKMAIQHLRGGNPMHIFPSGAVSDLAPKEGWIVRDRAWQEPAIKFIRKMKVPVVPVRFFDGNSKFYYSLGLINWRVRTVKLVSELFNKGNQVQRIGIGKIIPAEAFDNYGDIDSFGKFLRSSVYDMKPEGEPVSRKSLLGVSD